MIETWFKFYYTWCKTIRTMPDKERLTVMDLIVDTAICCAEDKEQSAPDGIPQVLRGWVEILIEKLREDYSMIENGKERKRDAVNKRWAKAKGKEDPDTVPEVLPSEESKEEPETKSRYAIEHEILLHRPDDEKLSFCRSNNLTCINSYHAWTAVFIETCKGEGRTHKDDADVIDHFNKWFFKLKMSNSKDKMERLTHYLGYYRNLWPEYSQPLGKTIQ